MFTSIFSCKLATKPGLVLDQKPAVKAKTERGILCCWCYSKINAKGEVVGMKIVPTASVNAYWGLCYFNQGVRFSH